MSAPLPMSTPSSMNALQVSWTDRLLGRSRIEVPCLVQVERTADALFTHAVPEGVDVNPGDVVLVHGAPSHVPFGTVASYPCRATVVRGGPLDRIRARLDGLFALTELYEVGFQPSHDPGLQSIRAGRV
jgi:hypothetical protein